MILNKSNMKNIVGICESGGCYHAYITYNSTQTKQKKFSILKYGDAEAMRLAVSYRRELELKYRGKTVIPEEMVQKTEYHQQSEQNIKSLKELKSEAVARYRKEKIELLAKREKILQKKAGKYIYRIDSLEKGHGWLLMIEINNNTLYHHIFRDSKYSGIKQALVAAKNERKNQFKKHNLILAEGRKYQHHLRSTNKTGTTGVCVTGGYCHAYINVEEGKRKLKKFSVDKYGEDMALTLAKEWRRDMELVVYGSIDG